VRAAVCHEFGKPLQVEDIVVDAPQAGEVKVRMAATAICHSDIHIIRGEWNGDLPIVVGHEAAGVVEEVGDGVRFFKPGDPVVVSLLRSCGWCPSCAVGASHRCSGTFAMDTTSRLHSPDGEPIIQGLHTAAFAQYAVVDQSQLVRVPEDLPLDRAALLACGVVTGVGAVVNTAQVRPGEAVAVIGCGGVGLNAVQGAALAGANPIVALDVLDTKLQSAREFGATHALNARREDIGPAVLDLTDGRGADYAFVTVGIPEAVSQALTLVREGGSAVLVGIPRIEARVPLSIFDVVAGEMRILGSNMGSTRLSVDVPRLIELYRQGRLKLDELITARYPLEQINEAIESTERGEAIRNVIVFSSDHR
jgi:NDMA-dependent alcohol dehydrogenase